MATVLRLPLAALILPALFAPMFSAGVAGAQMAGVNSHGVLRVQIVFTDERKCAIQARVQMMGGVSNAPVTEGYTNAECMIEFNGVAIGNYHLIVSGEGIETTDSGVVEVDSRKMTQQILITVKRTGEDQEHGTAGTPTISAADLNVPPSARKEFDRASELIAKENWKGAIERLQKSLSIYPQYAAAYNNLGFIYGRLGERAKEREVLQRATEVDDHFAPAYANLARVDIQDRNLVSAEALLRKATTYDPGNPQTLTLLAQVQFLQRHYDDAIANSRKVHSLTHEPHALAHYVAARALEHENRLSEAADQLQTLLAEAPSGELADAARKLLAALREELANITH